MAIVYTASFNNYDRVINPYFFSPGFEYLAYCDRLTSVGKGWTKRLRDACDENASFLNRHLKISPPSEIREHEYSIYVDGNILIRGDMNYLMLQFKNSGAAIGLVVHPHRTSISQEADACIQYNKLPASSHDRLHDQVRRYQLSGLPANHILTENNIIFRWHMHPQASALSDEWMSEYEQGVPRDQISLPYVLWKNQISVLYWEWNSRSSNPYFSLHGHNTTFRRNLEDRLYVRSLASSSFSPLHRVTRRLNDLYSRLSRQIWI